MRLTGVAAHSARAWMGRNAIHAAGEVLRRLEAYAPAQVEVDGLVYRESLNAVLVSGGTATNVIPDSCVVTVNYRFAPSATSSRRRRTCASCSTAYDVVIIDAAPGARPGLDDPGGAGVRARASSRSPAERPRRSTAGPTSRGSPRSASRR